MTFLVIRVFFSHLIFIEFNSHIMWGAISEKTGASSLMFLCLRNEDKEQFTSTYVVLFMHVIISNLVLPQVLFEVGNFIVNILSFYKGVDSCFVICNPSVVYVAFFVHIAAEESFYK